MYDVLTMPVMLNGYIPYNTVSRGVCMLYIIAGRALKLACFAQNPELVQTNKQTNRQID